MMKTNRNVHVRKSATAEQLTKTDLLIVADLFLEAPQFDKILDMDFQLTGSGSVAVIPCMLMLMLHLL